MNGDPLLHQHPSAARPRRLATRFVGLSMAVLLLVQAAGFLALGASIDQRSRAVLSDELQVGERVWQRLLAQRADSLRQGARVLAADQGFRSTLALGDMATVQDALANTAERLGAGVAAWVNAQGALQAQHDGRSQAEDVRTLQRTVLALARDQGGSQVAMLAGEVFQFIAVPVRAPTTIGWLVMGVAMDEAMVRDMHTLSGLDVALAITQADGSLRAGPSSLGARAAQALAVQDGQVTLDGEAHMVQRVPLVAGNAAQVLLLRSVNAAVAPFRTLQWALLAITVGGLLLFGLFSQVLAQRITTPLRALMRASEKLGRGDYSEPVQHLEQTDEVGQLARAFDRMRLNIANHQAEVQRLAYWDRLTGLPNRAQFRDRVAQTLQAGQAPLSVLILNLDRFKHINDVLGFAFGDEVLKAVGQRITGQLVREGDLVARLSGDAFGVLLPGTEAEEALRVADRISAAFELPLVLGEQQVDIGAGMGVASWPRHAQDTDTLIGHAEVAMYTAKRKLAQALVYDPALDAGSEATLSLLTELRQAVERDELRLFLQPKIGLQNGQVVGAEALVRWQHPTRGMVPPMKFIPFAEQTGFVRQLTLWIFEATAREWPRLQALGLQRVSVNLSTRDLMDSELPQRLDRILARHGVGPQAFCLEITESAIMDEPQRAEATLNALAAAGYKLSIDDYGTGYSSLSYVAGLPVHELKIDKSFVMGMAEVPKHAAIVRSTIDLAHHLGLSVVAEGVENAAILALLRSLDCDEAQGYHMSKPLPATDLPAFVQRWQAQRAAQPAASPALH